MKIKHKKAVRDQQQYAFYALLVGFYCMISCLSVVVSSRTIPCPLPFMSSNLTLFGGTLVLPLMFTLQDIVTEVYGCDYAIRMIKWGLVCLWFFIGCMELVTHLPIPVTMPYHDIAYQTVFTPLWRHVLAITIGLFIGGKINSYLLDKWKRLLHGKQLWARLMGSSAVGEMTLQLLVGSIGWIGIVSFSAIILPYVCLSYLMTLFVTILAVPFVYVVTVWLKLEENITENYEYFDAHKELRSINSRTTSLKK